MKNSINYYTSGKGNLCYYTSILNINATQTDTKFYKIAKEIKSTATLDSGSHITFQIAPMNWANISLEPGFHAKPGSFLHSFVAGHHPSDSYLVSYRDVEQPEDSNNIEDIIKNFKKEKELKIDIISFPNPASNNVKICVKTIPYSDSKEVKLKFYNFDGKLLFISNIKLNEIFPFNLQGFASGLYFISAESDSDDSGNKLISAKLIQIIK